MYCLSSRRLSHEHVAHQCGTLRFGTRPGPRRPRRRIAGSSRTPTCSWWTAASCRHPLGVGPALTIIANALRVAAKVVGRSLTARRPLMTVTRRCRSAGAVPPGPTHPRRPGCGCASRSSAIKLARHARSRRGGCGGGSSGTIFGKKYPPGLNEEEAENVPSGTTRRSTPCSPAACKPECRPIPAGTPQFLSPCDGTVQDVGRVDGRQAADRQGDRVHARVAARRSDTAPFDGGHLRDRLPVADRLPPRLQSAGRASGGGRARPRLPAARPPAVPAGRVPGLHSERAHDPPPFDAARPCLVVMVAGWGVGNITLPLAPGFAPGRGRVESFGWDLAAGRPPRRMGRDLRARFHGRAANAARGRRDALGVPQREGPLWTASVPARASPPTLADRRPQDVEARPARPAREGRDDLVLVAGLGNPVAAAYAAFVARELRGEAVLIEGAGIARAAACRPEFSSRRSAHADARRRDRPRPRRGPDRLRRAAPVGGRATGAGRPGGDGTSMVARIRRHRRQLFRVHLDDSDAEEVERFALSRFREVAPRSPGWSSSAPATCSARTPP